jgi:hypothetical protein
MIWLLVILAGIGLSHLIVDGSIFSRPRGWVVEKGPAWLKQLVTCYQCTGFWTGIVCGLMSGIFINELVLDGWWARLLALPVLYGFTVSYLSMAAAATLNYLDRPWGEK